MNTVTAVGSVGSNGELLVYNGRFDTCRVLTFRARPDADLSATQVARAYARMTGIEIMKMNEFAAFIESLLQGSPA